MQRGVTRARGKLTERRTCLQVTFDQEARGDGTVPETKRAKGGSKKSLCPHGPGVSDPHSNKKAKRGGWMSTSPAPQDPCLCPGSLKVSRDIDQQVQRSTWRWGNGPLNGIACVPASRRCRVRARVAAVLACTDLEQEEGVIRELGLSGVRAFPPLQWGFPG